MHVAQIFPLKFGHSVGARAERETSHLRTSYLPLYIGDADLLACLFIIIVPLAVDQVNTSEFGVRLGASRKPLTLCVDLANLLALYRVPGLPRP